MHMILRYGTQIIHFSPRSASTMVSATANSPNSIGSTRKELVLMALRTMLLTWATSPCLEENAGSRTAWMAAPRLLTMSLGNWSPRL